MASAGSRWSPPPPQTLQIGGGAVKEKDDGADGAGAGADGEPAAMGGAADAAGWDGTAAG